MVVESGMGLTSWLTVLFIGLKLTHFINWSWVWVLSPLWIPLVFVLAVATSVGIVYGGLWFVVEVVAPIVNIPLKAWQRKRELNEVKAMTKRTLERELALADEVETNWEQKLWEVPAYVSRKMDTLDAASDAELVKAEAAPDEKLLITPEIEKEAKRLAKEAADNMRKQAKREYDTAMRQTAEFRMSGI